MSSTDRKKYAQTANSPGWKLVNNRWLWWDGNRYTAEWDGTSSWAIEPPKLKTYKPLKPGAAKLR